MQNYVVVILMKISWIYPSDNFIHNIICIIFWRKVCIVYIKEYIIPNPLFWSLGPLCVILNNYSDVYFGDTR